MQQLFGKNKEFLQNLLSSSVMQRSDQLPEAKSNYFMADSQQPDKLYFLVLVM